MSLTKCPIQVVMTAMEGFDHPKLDWVQEISFRKAPRGDGGGITVTFYCEVPEGIVRSGNVVDKVGGERYGGQYRVSAFDLDVMVQDPIFAKHKMHDILVGLFHKLPDSRKE